ncbi:hypothetical protein GGTG_12032 [Gaeumannomyces tritici R3-111a-1]|uniref:Heterokaryon incompatibility domain-containing protein n=1 Tax=Gaeumannomyces tritici (strain R3-111a-1) TaxID=644352 RepID=J3PEV3_GAET3|nr:hypothetical protein GGTG_12032 [Gaeumannomyces tritici R3-111a-1]EJT71011.1 hypothetical protein GGTG_12032 [Gaeumannomyces tritici R3-111a-1]
MEHLRAAISGPPFELAEILALQSKADQLADTIESRSEPFDHEASVRMIEALEALAAVALANPLNVNGYFVDLVNIEKAFRRMPDQVCRLKALLFRALKLPDLCSPPAPRDAAPVCQYCNWILERALANPESVVHDPIGLGRWPYYTFSYLCIVDDWPEFPALRHRARTGCSLCSALHESVIDQPTKSATDPRTQFWLAYEVAYLDSPLKFELRGIQLYANPLAGTVNQNPMYERMHDSKGISWDRPIAGFCAEQEAETCASELSSIGIYPAGTDEVLCDHNVSFLRRVLGKPQDNRIAGFRPKRLIDLGLESKSDLRLVISLNSSQEPVPYAALSYCWGPPEDAPWQLMTTPETIKRHCAYISMDALPQVVKDAVHVCRLLRVRYLWVDALCIVQGCLRDWEEQSRDMGQIFQSSWVTICAMQSSTCREGFLHTKNRRARIRNIGHKSPILPHRWVKLTLKPFSRRGRIDGLQSHLSKPGETSFFHWDTVVSPWNSRGWVFQEKLLSPRKAIFGDEMVHVQVGDQVFCENGTRESLSCDAGGVGRFWNPSSAFTMHIGNNDKQHLLHKWCQLLPDFMTDKKWTDDRDVLPGLSGISRIFAAKLQDRFLAGLWEADLHMGLLFMDYTRRQSLAILVASFARGQGRSECAPSWSWASRRVIRHHEIYEGLKCRTRSHMRGEMDVIQSRIRVDGNNPYGRLMKGGSILVAGRAVTPQAGFFAYPRGPFHYKRFSNGCIVRLEPDWQPVHSWTPLPPEQDLTPVELEHQAQEDAAQADLESTLRLLLVSSCCPRQWSGPEIKSPLVREEHEDQIWPLDRELTQEEQEAREISWEIQCRRFYERYDVADAFFDDGDLDQATASAGCAACLSEAQGTIRDCWGIIICPAPGRDRGYLRVGWFSCQGRDGGLDLFAGAEKETIELF